MKLDATQIEYIRDYIDAFDVKYYELREEFLDHMILRVEEKMQGSDVAFIRAVMDAKEEFGPNGFKKIMIERERYLTKQYKARYQQVLRSYFKFPTIIVSMLIAIALFKIAGMFQHPVKLLVILVFATTLLSLGELLLSLKFRKIAMQPLLKVSVFFKSFSLNLIMVNMCMSLNFFNDGSINSPVIIACFSVLATVSVMGCLSYRKLRKEVITDVKRLYFS